MRKLSAVCGLLLLGAGLAAAPAMAQTIPMHSGHMSHGSAQMRSEGSGIHYPNRLNEAPYTF